MKVAHACLLATLGLVALPYACSPIYRFDDPRPFAGTHLHNPYASRTGRWQRANLHAHGIAWGGLTSGRQPSAEIVQSYRRLGYDVPGVSNYQRIAAFDGVDTLPVYEHGYNLNKQHQLAIGARQVDWFDFPLGQTLSHQQYVIDRLRRTSELVAIVHPHTRGAYSAEDVGRLTRYQLLEIVNGPFRSDEPWDAALSSGHAVWALGSDDTHDTTDPRRAAAAWTMIDAPSATTPDILASLKAGRAYAAARNGDQPAPVDVHLEAVDVTGETFTVTTTGAPATFTFIGQHGVVRRVVAHASSASYTFGAHDTYVRTVVEAPSTTIFLNPVLRHDGRGVLVREASVDVGATWLFRALWAGAVLVGARLVRRRRPADRTSSAALDALPAVDRETA